MPQILQLCHHQVPYVLMKMSIPVITTTKVGSSGTLPRIPESRSSFNRASPFASAVLVSCAVLVIGNRFNSFPLKKKENKRVVVKHKSRLKRKEEKRREKVPHGWFCA